MLKLGRGHPKWGTLTKRGRLSTVDLLVQTSLHQLLLIFINYYFDYNTNYLSEEVNSTKPSPSVGVSWFKLTSTTHGQVIK
jgi:hypothetical protein